ncbi:MAG: asparagine synthase C-terminal domain-containing protein [Pseudomonadota bacterium]
MTINSTNSFYQSKNRENISVEIDADRHSTIGQSGRVQFRGYVHGRTLEGVAREAIQQDRESVLSWLNGLDGHFSLIVKGSEFTFAAVDPVRSLPIIWTQSENGVVLSDDGPAIEKRLGLDASVINPSMARAVALSGFTIGNSTLYPQVKQLGPGEVLWLEKGEMLERSYFHWDPWQPFEAQVDDLRKPLSQLNQKLIEDLVASANGRQILLPLSAGLDSRLIVSGLQEFGYQNVRCVSYGLAGNREAKTSYAIAKRLGYEWTFVPYTQSKMREIFHSSEYAAFKTFSDSLTSIHFPQEYPMLLAMLTEHDLDPEAICVNGQSGDFIAGNHVPQLMFEPGGDRQERLDRIVRALLAKHYKHWASLVDDESLTLVGDLLKQEIDKIGGLPEDPYGDHGIYEYCEFQDRQSKYVLNGQRAYEFFGLDWRLPLWDRAYLDFWARAPLAAKKNENLYRTVLEEDNWAGVWKGVSVNPTRIRPGWLVPIRLVAKAMHAPLGRERWHNFERRYLTYWMSSTCAYAAWPFRQVAADQRGAYSAIAWHIADYLVSKGLRWDGRLMDDAA